MIKNDERVELVKTQIRNKLKLISDNLLKREDRVIFELVMYSSFKEMVESFLILSEHGYELGASSLIRTMYETILWYEARFNIHPNDVKDFDTFFINKKLSEYKNKNGKNFTFSMLHKSFIKKVNLGTEKENAQLNKLYEYLNGYTHISSNHINKTAEKNDDQIIIKGSVPLLGIGTKLKYHYNQLTVVYIIVSLYELCQQIFDEV
jgi:hypothetical protein